MEYTTFRNKNRGYMKLEVWQKSMELFDFTWRLVKNSDVDLRLRSQIYGSVQSISANIAEGYSRRTVNDYLRFLYISLGSLSESLTRLAGLKETGQISSSQFEEIDKLHYEVENKLLRLVQSLENKKDEGSWMDRISEEEEIYIPGSESLELDKESNENADVPILQHSSTAILQSRAAEKLVTGDWSKRGNG